MSRHRRWQIIPAVVFLCVVSGLVSANERSAVWSRLYRRAESLDNKLTLMQSVARNPTQDLIPLLVGALNELNTTREQLSTGTERYVRTALTKLVVRLIGDIGASEAGHLVFDVSRYADDPYLRGEAIFTTFARGRLQIVLRT